MYALRSIMQYGGPQNHGVLKEEILRIKELRKQNWAEGEDWFTGL